MRRINFENLLGPDPTSTRHPQTFPFDFTHTSTPFSKQTVALYRQIYSPNEPKKVPNCQTARLASGQCYLESFC